MNDTRQPIRLKPECISCLVRRQIERYPADASDSDKIRYMQSVLREVALADDTMSAPEIADGIYKIQRRMFGINKDFTEIKRHFNDLMTALAPEITEKINRSDEPLKAAVQYAMTGNYIDFAAMDSVDENKLRELLKKAADDPIDEIEYERLKRDLESASNIVFLTDNCGEIVLDKILIETALKLNPALDVTVIVRGEPVVNDATIEDAEQTGLTELARVIGNGNSVAGNCLNLISEQARRIMEGADVIISKGQGNFETLQKCGMNVYYIFMCKCKMFADRFNVPLYSGMMINDRSI